MPSPQPITDEEFRRIIDEIMKVKPYCKNISLALFHSWKFATMLWFHYYLGLRPRTIRLIEIKHINFKDKTLFVPAMNVKIKVADTFPLPEVLWKKLILWLKIRCKIVHNCKWLFPISKLPFKEQDKNYLGEKVRSILKKLNISKVSWIDKANFPHYNKCLYSLRHSYGLRVWQKTKNIKFVAIMLGHHDIMLRHTARYLSLSNEEERKEIMQKIYL